MAELGDFSEPERLPTSATLARLGSYTWRPGNKTSGGRKTRQDVYRGRHVGQGYNPDAPYEGKR